MEDSWSLVYKIFLLGTLCSTALAEPPSLESAPTVRLPGSDGITVTWSAWSEDTDRGSGPVASYFVLVRSTVDAGFDTEVEAGPELSIKVEPLKSEEEYVFTVVCADGNGDRGVPSPELTVTIPCGVPSEAPILTSLDTVNTTALRLTWTPPPQSSWGCSSLEDVMVTYAYKRAAVDDFPLFPDNQRTPINAGELIIAGLEACTTYDVIVAMYASTAYEFSDAVSVINGTTELELVGPINNPSAISQASLGAGLILTWEEPSVSGCTPDYYTISYVLTSRLACPDEEVTPDNFEVTDIPQTTYVLSTLDYYSQYDFEITGVNDLGMGEAVVYTAATLDAVPVSAPVPTLREDLSAPGELHFNWTAIPCEDIQGTFRRYLGELFKDSKRVKLVRSGNFDDREGSFTELLGCTEYGFRVRATNAREAGPFSEFLMVTTPEIAPGFVKDLSWMVHPDVPTSLEISWVPDETEPCLAIEYTVEYTLSVQDQCEESDSDTPTMVGPIVMAPETSLLIEGLEPYSTYEVAVYASNDGGNSSRVVTMAVTGEQAPTGTPSGVGAFIVEYSELAFSFTNLPCGTRGGRIFQYQYELRNVETGEVTNGTTPTQEVMLENLERYTEYGIRIRAENSAGVGEFSEEVLQYTSEGFPTEPLEVATYDIPAASLPLTWMPPAEPNGYITRYEVEVSDLGSGESMTLNFTDVYTKPHRLLVSDVEPTMEYSVMVRAINEAGASNWSKPITVEIVEGAPSPVADLMVEEITEDSIRITWNPPLQPKGTISRYTGEYTVGERPYLHTEETTQVTKFFETTPEDTFLDLVDLEPSTEYLITVWAHTTQERGEPVMVKQFTMVPDDVPPPTDVMLLTAEVRDDGTLVVKLPPTSYKYATHYQIGIHCSDVESEPLFFGGANYSTECSYIAGEVPNMEKEQEFIIGDGETYSGFENVPLDKEREYDVYVSLVSRTKESTSVTWSSEPLIAEEKSAALVLLWIFIIILLIVLLVILILCIACYCRKRQEKKKPLSSPEENVPLE